MILQLTDTDKFSMIATFISTFGMAMQTQGFHEGIVFISLWSSSCWNLTFQVTNFSEKGLQMDQLYKEEWTSFDVWLGEKIREKKN